jgi:hypothetical protein
MAGTIIADTIQATSQQISLNVGNTTILTASSTGLTLIPTTNVNINVTNSTVAFGSGNVTNPSISFSGNTSTGMYMPVANTIAFATAGTEDMRITATGSVGIGTSSPNASVKTTIKASSTGEYQIQLEQNNATDGYALRCSAADGDLTINRYASSTFTERMRIDSSGNMFVGGSTQNTATKPVYSSTTAKAWVSCSIASSTVTVGASFNVSSVTRNGGGDYTINFSSALLDTSYAIAGIASGPGGANAQVAGYNGGGVAVGSYRFYVLNMSNITPTEPNNFYLIFFR